jgi:hypothetical protein
MVISAVSTGPSALRAAVEVVGWGCEEKLRRVPSADRSTKNSTAR